MACLGTRNASIAPNSIWKRWYGPGARAFRSLGLRAACAVYIGYLSASLPIQFLASPAKSHLIRLSECSGTARSGLISRFADCRLERKRRNTSHLVLSWSLLFHVARSQTSKQSPLIP